MSIINVANDDYCWFKMLYGMKVITIKRPTLNNIAEKYNLIPGQFKNKRLLLGGILSIWESHFNNIQFKEDYENTQGITI